MLVAWHTSKDDGFIPTPAVNSFTRLSLQHYLAMETTVLPVRTDVFTYFSVIDLCHANMLMFRV